MITVGIVEDNAFATAMLQRLIDATDDLACGFACGSVEDALENLRENVPDVLLVDVHLPGMSGVDVAGRVVELYPDVRLLMLTADDDSSTIVAALEAGACGYLLKNSSGDEIIGGIREAFNGGVPLTKEVARKMVDAFREKIIR